MRLTIAGDERPAPAGLADSAAAAKPIASPASQSAIAQASCARRLAR